MQSYKIISPEKNEMSRFLTFISIYFTQKRFRHLLYFFAADLWSRGSSKEKKRVSTQKKSRTKPSFVAIAAAQ